MVAMRAAMAAEMGAGSRRGAGAAAAGAAAPAESSNTSSGIVALLDASSARRVGASGACALGSHQVTNNTPACSASAITSATTSRHDSGDTHAR